MNELLQSLIGYSFTGGLYAVALAAVLVWVTLGMVAPRVMVWPLLLVVAAFPSSSLLIAESGIGFDVYAKGSGYLVFSLFEITIMAAALCALLRGLYLRAHALRSARPGLAVPARVGNPLAPYYWAMAVIVGAYAVASFISPRDTWLSQVGRAGVTYLLLQGMLVAALLESVDSRESLRRLMLALAAVVALRMLWGGLRYVALGGDPANFYENSGSLAKITFWDINDSIWASMLACALVWLAATKERWSQMSRGALFAFALYCLAIAAMSARRTSQGGALLALATLWLLLPRGRKWWVLALVLAILPLAAYKLAARMEDNRSWVDRIFNAEQKGLYELDPRRQRFYELQVALRSVEKNPWFGVGPAGAFDPPSAIGLEYHQGNYHFVHSGLGHVLLKTGIVGLLIFLGLLVAYFRAWWQQWRQAPPHYRTLLVASACGFATGLPNLLAGTPMIESRTMMLMGLAFALPLLVARAARTEQAPQPTVAPGVAARRGVMLGWVR